MNAVIPKNPNRTGQGAVPQAWAHRRGWMSECSYQPKRMSFGNISVLSVPQTVPGCHVGESELMQTKSVPRPLLTLKLWEWSQARAKTMYWPLVSTSGPGAMGPAHADLMLPGQCLTC